MKYADRTIEPQEFRCDSCAYFKARAIYEHPCAELGAKDYDFPCTRYTINPQQWDNTARAKLLQALHLIHEANISIADLKGLLYSAERLPAKHPFGSRVWIAVGKGKESFKLRCTAIGKTTIGKAVSASSRFTLMSETGAIINVSDAELIPDTEISAIDAINLAFNLDFDDKKTKTKPKDKPVKPIAQRIALRGGSDEDDVPAEPVNPKPKVKAKAKAKKVVLKIRGKVVKSAVKR